jgi:hypothetical protein
MIDLDLNYYQEFLNEGGPFYADLAQFKESEFNEWAEANFENLGTAESIEEISPNTEEIKEFLKSGYNPTLGACHYKSREVSRISDGEYKHYTGFIHTPESRYNFISHSFNVKNGQIKDFDRLNEKTHEPEKLGQGYSFPFTFYGIKIPFDFVIKYSEGDFSKQRPLLIEYLKENGIK